MSMLGKTDKELLGKMVNLTPEGKVVQSPVRVEGNRQVKSAIKLQELGLVIFEGGWVRPVDRVLNRCF